MWWEGEAIVSRISEWIFVVVVPRPSASYRSGSEGDIYNNYCTDSVSHKIARRRRAPHTWEHSYLRVAIRQIDELRQQVRHRLQIVFSSLSREMIHRYLPTLGHYSSNCDDKDPATFPKEGTVNVGESDRCEFAVLS